MRRGRTPAPRLNARDPCQTLDETEALSAAVLAQERVDLVYDHVAKVAEEPRDGSVAAHEHGLEGLRRNLQDA